MLLQIKLSTPGHLIFQDSPLGVRVADLVTGFPASINAAATWDRKLVRERGEAMGYQHRTKGVNVQLVGLCSGCCFVPVLTPYHLIYFL